MATYVQAEGSDTWHWCRNCDKRRRIKTVGKTRATKPPSGNGELCDECKGKQRGGRCS